MFLLLCKAFCCKPSSSGGHSALQKKAGGDSDKVRILSITIDPDYDTPEIMGEYLDHLQ
ncbi:SCO family protein [Candidatus Moduliflexota bacterium]